MNKTIAYITDIHLDESISLEHGVNPRHNLIKILEDIDARGIREVVFGGDIGEASSYRWLFDSLGKYQWRITLGNHDRYEDVRPYFTRASENLDGKLYYSEEDASFKYLFLDSSADEVSQTQFEWLREQLRTSKSLVIFIHHPILAIDTAVDKIFPLQGREQLQELLLGCNNPISVFTGHYHLTDEQTAGNVTQYVTAAGSFQLRRAAEMQIDASTFGYRIITLSDEGLTSQVVKFKSSGVLETT